MARPKKIPKVLIQGILLSMSAIVGAYASTNFSQVFKNPFSFPNTLYAFFSVFGFFLGLSLAILLVMFVILIFWSPLLKVSIEFGSDMKKLIPGFNKTRPVYKQKLITIKSLVNCFNSHSRIFGAIYFLTIAFLVLGPRQEVLTPVIMIITLILVIVAYHAVWMDQANGQNEVKLDADALDKLFRMGF